MPMADAQSPHPRVGLALGGGAARGWAHIGVIRALAEHGVRIDLVCGTSIGALVGAVFASGGLDRLEQWVLAMKLRDVMSFVDVQLTTGMLKGERLVRFLRTQMPDQPIEELAMPFAAVATALHTGAEVWLRSGPLVDAVRASVSIPGLFLPLRHQDQLLVDGGLVNPVPVSLARAMGADLVIAVDLASDLMGRHLADLQPENGWRDLLPDSLVEWLPPATPAEPRMPSMLDVMATGLNIMQVRIARSRMAGDPPDVIVAPRLAHLGLLEFYRGTEAIEAGRRAVSLALPGLRALGLAAG